MKRLFAVVLCLLLAPLGAHADETGDAVAHKYFGRTKAADTKALATMTLVAKNGSKKVRKLEVNYQEGAQGKNAFIVFTDPADIAGTKFLTLSKRGADADQRLFLPALKKVRKISSSSKDGEFVNSDLFYYDMEERYLEDNTYTFLSDNETLADKAFAGMKFTKIAMKPTDPNAPYSKAVAWVNMANNFIYKMDCFDKKDGALLKTILFVKVETIKGVLVPTQTLVSNVKKGTKTLMAMANVQVNIGLKDDVFSVKNLEQ